MTRSEALRVAKAAAKAGHNAITISQECDRRTGVPDPQGYVVETSNTCWNPRRYTSLEEAGDLR
ncbi:MAG TPA: hypothetical protein VMX12_02510 [Acidimicrobiia bacterium]|nr:hypothetical protein [Acidimicrobiia bacterium]